MATLIRHSYLIVVTVKFHRNSWARNPIRKLSEYHDHRIIILMIIMYIVVEGIEFSWLDE